MIQELIQTLSPEERETLAQRVRANGSSIYKLIDVVMQDPSLTKEQVQKKLKINENTYFKNLSLAKDEIYEVIKLHLKNSYDDLILSNVLYRRGLDVHASKLRLKLESEYDNLGWWSVLHELYSLEMMVAYTKCDIPRMEKVRDKSIRNADRLSDYIRVDKDVIVEMARVERGELKEKQFDAYAANANKLLKLARDLGHHIPVFNALHAQFVFYTKYKIDVRKAKEIIREIQALVSKYKDKMIPYTVNVAWLNTLSFYVNFEADYKPTIEIKKVDEAIGLHGLLYDAEALINFCCYYFWQGDKANFSKRLDQFKKMPTDKTLHYKLAFLNGLRAYLYEDVKAFSNSLNQFYTDEISREYDDYDLMLRYLELLILISEKNYALAADKLEAAIKFVRRNFTTHRIAIEKQHWDMLRTAIQGKAVKSPGTMVYKQTEFLYDELVNMK